jgi:hypothetical protein
VISLDLASAAIHASTRGWSHPQALPCAPPIAAGSIERAALHFAVDGDSALDGSAELYQEPLEHGAKLLGVKPVE